MVQITEGSTDAMADTVSMALAELVRKAELNGDVDFLREGVRVLSQAVSGFCAGVEPTDDVTIVAVGRH